MQAAESGSCVANSDEIGFKFFEHGGASGDCLESLQDGEAMQLEDLS